MDVNTHLHLCVLGLCEWSPGGNHQLLPPWEKLLLGFRVRFVFTLWTLAGLTNLISLFALFARKLRK